LVGDRHGLEQTGRCWRVQDVSGGYVLCDIRAGSNRGRYVLSGLAFSQRSDLPLLPLVATIREQ
jgi:hypothetical protein